MKRHGVALAWRHLCKRSVTFFSFFWGGHTFIIVAEFFPGTFSDAYFKGRQAPSRCSGRDPSYSRSPHLLAHSLQLSHAGPLLSLSRPPPPPPQARLCPQSGSAGGLHPWKWHLLHQHPEVLNCPPPAEAFIIRSKPQGTVGPHNISPAYKGFRANLQGLNYSPSSTTSGKTTELIPLHSYVSPLLFQ